MTMVDLHHPGADAFTIAPPVSDDPRSYRAARRRYSLSCAGAARRIAATRDTYLPFGVPANTGACVGGGALAPASFPDFRNPYTARFLPKEASAAFPAHGVGYAPTQTTACGTWASGCAPWVSACAPRPCGAAIPASRVCGAAVAASPSCCRRWAACKSVAYPDHLNFL